MKKQIRIKESIEPADLQRKIDQTIKWINEGVTVTVRIKTVRRRTPLMDQNLDIMKMAFKLLDPNIDIR